MAWRISTPMSNNLTWKSRPPRPEAKKLVFELDELRILNEYCTPLERVLFLLGLNCGFGAAESGTLRMNEIHLFQAHPDAQHIGFESSPADSFIFRVRLKSRVYGQHLLWPQTVDAIQWAIKRRAEVGKVSPESLLLVSNRGLPLFRTTSGGNSGQRIKKHLAQWAAQASVCGLSRVSKALVWQTPQDRQQPNPPLRRWRNSRCIPLPRTSGKER